MKKNLFFILNITLLVSLVLSGCKKEKEPGNYMTIDGSTYELDHGVYFYYNDDEELGVYSVCLSSEGMVFTYGDGWSGEGNYLWLEFLSSSKQGISSGTYTYYSTYSEFTFYDSYWGLNWSMTKDDYVYKYFVDGTIDVKDYGDGEYEFTVNCEDELGNAVTAHFRGMLSLESRTGAKPALTLQ